MDGQHFPASKVEALALEYAKAQLNDSMTPEEFYNAYKNACEKIRDAATQDSRARTLKAQP